jgi:hypothetical protein
LLPAKYRWRFGSDGPTPLLAAKIGAAIQNGNQARLLDLFEKGGLAWETSSPLGSQRWLALQVGGVYHQSAHSSLLKPPAAAWQDVLRAAAKHLENPQIPKYSQAMRSLPVR